MIYETRWASDGWIRADWDKWTLFVVLRPTGRPLHSHVHADAGSFILFRAGIPVVIDPGRGSYQSADAWAVGAAAHNAPVIGDLGISISRRGYFCDAYLAVERPSWSLEDDTLELSSRSLARVARCHTWRRRLVPRRDGLDVADHVHGAGPVAVNLSIASGNLAGSQHGAVGRLRDGTPLRLSTLSEGWETAVAGPDDPRGGWWPGYGHQEPCSRVLCTRRRQSSETLIVRIESPCAE